MTYCYDLEDPKIGQSNTVIRAQIAAQRIPTFVDGLLSGTRPLNERAVELLYGEYRAYCGSRRPFRSRIERCQQVSVHPFEYWSVSQLLEFLRDPQHAKRREVVGVLYVLWAEVTI